MTIAALTLALGIAFTGCQIQSVPRGIASAPTPAMPTIAPAPATPSGQVIEPEIVAVASRLALAGDIPAALRTVELARDPRQRARAATALVEAMAETNPTQAAAVALALPAGPARTNAVEIAARAWARRDADPPLHWAAHLTDAAIAHAAQSAVTAELVRENPRAALARIQAMPASPAQNDMLGMAAASWAGRDPNDAVAWLREIPDERLRQQMTPRIAFAIAQTNPPRALELTETLPAGRDRWLVVSAIAQTWTAVNPKAVQAWVGNLPAGPEREAARAGVESAFGGSARRLTISPVDSFRAGSFVHAGDPIFAAWLANQPRKMSQEEAILEFIRQREALDPAGMGVWVAGLTDWETRQRAKEVFLEEALRASPARAADWLRSLPGGERTDEMVEKTARQWLQIDPRAAEAWLRETNLPSYRQEELLRHAPR